VTAKAARSTPPTMVNGRSVLVGGLVHTWCESQLKLALASGDPIQWDPGFRDRWMGQE